MTDAEYQRALAGAFADLECARADTTDHQRKVRRTCAAFVLGGPTAALGFYLGGIFVVVGALGITLTLLGVALGIAWLIADEDGSDCRRTLRRAERDYQRLLGERGAP